VSTILFVWLSSQKKTIVDYIRHPSPLASQWVSNHNSVGPYTPSYQIRVAPVLSSLLPRRICQTKPEVQHVSQRRKYWIEPRPPESWEENFVQLYCAVSEICEQTHTQTYTFITILHCPAGGRGKIRLHTCIGECACRRMKTWHSTPVRSCSRRVSFPLQCTADNRWIQLRLTPAFISGDENGVHTIVSWVFATMTQRRSDAMQYALLCPITSYRPVSGGLNEYMN